MAKILLVEDNTEMQMLLRELLEWGGHQVACGRSGHEGLATLASSPPPDLIISDLMMPGMDGYTFLQRVRGNPEWSGIRFIIMSANPHDERLSARAPDGPDGLLPKPFSLEDLDSILP